MITVGILSYRRPAALQRCLASLFACTTSPFELHIVNQGFLDPALERIYGQLSGRPGVRLTYLDHNLGCAGGRDLLVRSTRTPYLFFADDDLVFTRAWERPLLAAMERHADLGAVSPYLKEISSPFFGRFEWRQDTLLARCYGPREVRRLRDSQGLVGSDFLPGGCVLVRGCLFEEASFDLDCRHDWEDIDFWLQLRSTRWRLGLCLDSLVYHRRPGALWKRWAREYDAIRYDEDKLAATRSYFLGKWKLGGFEVVRGPRWLEWLRSRLRWALKRVLG